MTREEAIKSVKETTIKLVKEVAGMSLDWDDAHYDALQMAIKALEQEPSVTPTRKKGKWILTSDYLTTAYGSVDYVKCSCCGEDSLEEGNYCPNCGAEMESEE